MDINWLIEIAQILNHKIVRGARHFPYCSVCQSNVVDINAHRTRCR